MQKSKAHFEQVPLELVKKIARADVSEDNADGSVRTVAPILTKRLTPRRRHSCTKNGKRV